MEKNKLLKPWVLFTISGMLLSAGWWLNVFPVFILCGIAPLFAIVDQVQEDEAYWTNIEFILLALFVGYFASFRFDSGHIVSAIIHAIIFTLAFLGYNYAHQQLGARLGKFTILFFWLAIEYSLVKSPWRDQIHFLTDSFKYRQSWVNWNFNAGYLAVSLWILLCNLFMYMAVFRSGIFISWLIAAFALCTVPIIYSQFFIQSAGINKVQMISLYTSAKVSSGHYARVGELTARTAAWVSLLILLLAFVRNKIKS